MAGRLIGYARISTLKRMNSAERLSQLADEKLDEAFLERADAKHADRRQLKKLLRSATKGDTVVCRGMDRIGLNTEHLVGLIEFLTTRGVDVKFLDEQLTFRADDVAQVRMMLSTMRATSQFEQKLSAERALEASLRDLAPDRRGGAPCLSEEEISRLRRDAGAGLSKVALGNIYGISRTTVAKYLKGDAPSHDSRYKGRLHCLSEAQIADLFRDANAGVSKVALARKYGITRQSVFRYLSEIKTGRRQY